MNREEIVRQLDALIYNKRVQSAYQFIMLESIFETIEESSEDIRVIPLTDLFTQFAIITVSWVNEYQLLLKENASTANEIISKIEGSFFSRDKYQDIGKRLMNSTVGKWVIPNITKYEGLFRCTEDKNIYLSQAVFEEIYEHLRGWRKKNFEEARKLLYKYNPNKTNVIDQLFIQEGYLIELEEIERENTVKEDVSIRDNLDLEYLKYYIESKGYEYSYKTLSNFYLSLKSKPFIILSGISGTGKSKLVRLFAEAISAKFELIPVRPDWSDATELLGYKDINQVFHPGKLTQIITEAQKDSDRPYIVCLDEMNLARVEYYFSDFLALIESRHWEGESIVTDCLSNESAASGEPLSIPDNIYIVGTVNMDETTFQFSKKVLDRANTIELNDVDLTYSFEDEEAIEVAPMPVHNDALRSNYIILRDCKAYAALAKRVIDQLITLNEIFKPCQLQFAYRVRDEIIFYMAYNEAYDLMSEEEAFDYQLLQKVLPRINGTSLRLRETLLKLLGYCMGKKVDGQESYDLETWPKEIDEGIYPRSAAKLLEMLRRYDEDGFTSFWF